MTVKIYILLPVHNRRNITEQFIDCLVAQTYSDYHLVLIDDGSIDDTSEMVKSKINNLTIIKGSGNWWWAGSLQQGLEWLKKNQVQNDSLILFINDDVRFSADYLEQASNVMINKKGSLVLSKFKYQNGIEIIETGICADMQNLSFSVATSKEKINCLSTRGLFVYWSDVIKIGDFYPKLLPHYLSDYEFTIRANRKGFKCETSDKLLIDPNHETTGYHQINDESFFEYLKKFFSKKSPANPIYWSVFVFLTSQLSYVIPNLVRVWINAAKSTGKAFLISRKLCSLQ